MQASVQPVLSIVTVTYQDLAGLRSTLESVRPLSQQAGHKLEVLVQDAKTPGLETIVEEYSSWVEFVSASDQGIYDGMNQGMKRSRGQYIWFLNSGDLCVVKNWSDIESTITNAAGAMVMGEYLLDLGDAAIIRRRPKRRWYMYHALPTSHQAIFYPGDVARSMQYDVSYTVAGDYAFTCALWKAGVHTHLSDLGLAQFQSGGFSQQNSSQIAADAFRVQRDVLESPWVLRRLSQTLHCVTRKLRSVLTSSRHIKSLCNFRRGMK